MIDGDDLPPNPYLTYTHNGSEYTVFRGCKSTPPDELVPVLPGELQPDKEYLLTIWEGVCYIEEVKTVNGR